METLSILKKYFGYDTFRSGQESLINDILAGKNVLGIMPTGAGKSVCFQVPALMMKGLTLIVSPLISLMKDQVNALIQSGIAAAYINSSLTEKQIDLALKNARNNSYKLIYIAPERLLTKEFLSFASSADISMVTVDEAHCISQWGHDFRPSYSKIPEFVTALKNRPIISAFTATATPRVRDDIINQLKLVNPTVLVTGFDRPNLHFEVQKPKTKLPALIAFLESRKEQSGIVYCSTRATVEEVCEKLNQNGYNASRYHAGLSDIERHDNQDDFIYDRVQIMVATNAFGMGIDKSNVAFVAHYNMPKDIESYYQEAGRAGRDGEPADCILLYNGQDVRTNLWLIENSKVESSENGSSREQILEHDRGRLREMTFYCETNNCLRGYILKYFGENPPVYCGNCSNCNTSFETMDITVHTQKILSCVARMNERFGLVMLIDTLRGSKKERIIQLELDKLSTYGILSELSEQQLRAIIHHLILSGYLAKTDSEYPVIKLGEHARKGLRGEEAMIMKLPKDKDIARLVERQRAVKVDKRLLKALRNVRTDIAMKQHLPEHVILNDSTLTDMCIKIPRTLHELLTVSGVGQVKAERYGKLFLDAISDFLQNNKPDEMPPLQSGGFDPASVETTEEPVTVNLIADRINCVLLENGYKRISGKKINDWLLNKGFLTLITENNKNYKVPTERGTELGIKNEERFIRGERVKINIFEREAQEYIVSNAMNIYTT